MAFTGILGESAILPEGNKWSSGIKVNQHADNFPTFAI